MEVGIPVFCPKCKKYESGKYFHGTSGICDFCLNGVKGEEELNFKKSKQKENSRYSNYYEKNFNISLDTYNLIFHKQEGCCFICGIHQTKLNKRLAVDHDHSTNKIRGLLCGKCNTALGLLGDNINIIEKALAYLKYHKNEGF